MTTWSQYPHVRPVGSEPERILRSSRAAAADSILTNEANLAAQFAQALRVEDPWRDELDVLLEQTVNG